MNYLKVNLCLAFLLWVPSAFAGDLQATKIQEIQHLIKFVSESGCSFIRNGNEHTPKEAVEHINKKYEYFKDEIDSAEKFIELSATQSTITKKKYVIKCPGKEVIENQKWLLEELNNLRGKTGK